MVIVVDIEDNPLNVSGFRLCTFEVTDDFKILLFSHEIFWCSLVFSLQFQPKPVFRRTIFRHDDQTVVHAPALSLVVSSADKLNGDYISPSP